MTSRDIKLRNKLEPIASKKSISDILIFGSGMRGKEKPNDTDFMVIFKDKVNKEAEYAIRKELEKYYPNVAIISKTVKSMLEPSFDARESILFEAKSVLTGKSLAENYGFEQIGMFKYRTNSFSNAQKTRLYYALSGRSGSEGIMGLLEGKRLSASVIIVPLGKIEPMKEFLDSWKIEYTYFPILMPMRLNKKQILE